MLDPASSRILHQELGGPLILGSEKKTKNLTGFRSGKAFVNLWANDSPVFIRCQQNLKNDLQGLEPVV
jgi:hypothetical protein